MNEASLNYVAETLPCKGKKGDGEKERDVLKLY